MEASNANQSTHVHVDGRDVHMLRGEVTFLYAFVFALKPRVIVEIGSLHGGSARIMAQALIAAGAAPSPKTMFLMDPQPRFTDENRMFLADRATVIAKGSPQGFDGIPELTDSIDFAFVDGDHAEDAVRDDIVCVYSRLRSGGYILCHDAHYHQTKRGIDRAVSETGLIDCGLVSTAAQDNGDLEDGVSVFWGGLRLLRKPDSSAARPLPETKPIGVMAALRRAFGAS